MTENAVSDPPLPSAAPPPTAGDARDAAPGRLALVLGYTGLLPFVAGAWVLWQNEPGWRVLAGTAMVAYAVAIASFLGGLHWGLAMRGAARAGTHLVWGVVPALLAWLAALMPQAQALAALAGLLALCAVADRALLPAAGAAGWLRLRLRLTSGAVLCCLAGAIASHG